MLLMRLRTVVLTGRRFFFISRRFPSAFFLFCSALPLVPCYILYLPLWSSQTSPGAAAWRWRRSWGWSVLWSGDLFFLSFCYYFHSCTLLLLRFWFSEMTKTMAAGSNLNDFLCLHSFLLLVSVSLVFVLFFSFFPSLFCFSPLYPLLPSAPLFSLFPPHYLVTSPSSFFLVQPSSTAFIAKTACVFYNEDVQDHYYSGNGREIVTMKRSHNLWHLLLKRFLSAKSMEKTMKSASETAPFCNFKWYF